MLQRRCLVRVEILNRRRRSLIRVKIMNVRSFQCTFVLHRRSLVRVENLILRRRAVARAKIMESVLRIGGAGVHRNANKGAGLLGKQFTVQLTGVQRNYHRTRRKALRSRPQVLKILPDSGPTGSLRPPSGKILKT